jgi:CHASE2 domain-containing sensor protein
VLIGATANGVGDSFVTPISTNMKPIETLAHSVASILNKDFYLIPGWAIWLQLMMPLLLLIVGHVALTAKKGKEKSDADSAESKRNLALIFQRQGQLDTAFNV